MNHSLVISIIIQSMSNVKSYLELGIYEGETFEMIRPNVERCVGVDIVDKRKTKYRGYFYLCTTDEFFQKNEETFDAIFIDADHRFEQVKKDLLASLNILNIGGIIFIHDTDPSEKNLIQEGYCCDAYKIVDWIDRRFLNDLACLTLPIGREGLTIIKRKNERRVQCL